MKIPSDRVELPSEELVLAAAPLESLPGLTAASRLVVLGHPERSALDRPADAANGPFLITSRPTAQGTGWTVVMVASPQQTWTQEVYVVCANVAP